MKSQDLLAEKRQPSSLWFRIAVVIFLLFVLAAIPVFLKLRQASRAGACRANLRQIQAAKEQIAEQYGLFEDDPTPPEWLGYMKGRSMPRCLSGGQYAVGNIGKLPRCSVHGSYLETLTFGSFVTNFFIQSVAYDDASNAVLFNLRYEIDDCVATYRVHVGDRFGEFKVARYTGAPDNEVLILENAENQVIISRKCIPKDE